MTIDSGLEQYFDAWNSHQPERVPAALTDGGTYEDPTTGGPLAGDALAANVAGVLAGFPDVHFDVVSVSTNGDTASAQWRMRGTNTGPLPGGPATGGTLDLPGADFFTYDAEADKISSVVGYFDTATMLAQLGLQAHITPADMEPVTKFGYSLRVDSGRDTVPGAFTVTWIDIDAEHHPSLVEHTRAIVTEQLGNDDYLGSFLATVGRRNYTFTAWASADAAQEALRGHAHTTAMKMAQTGGFGDNAFGVTSVWQPLHLNGVFNPHGASRDLSELEGQWL
jgi:steroid delta-isomerase-like uncharacterized protein